MFLKVISANISQFISIGDKDRIQDFIRKHGAKVEVDNEGYAIEYSDKDVANYFGCVGGNDTEEVLGIKLRSREVVEEFDEEEIDFE